MITMIFLTIVVASALLSRAAIADAGMGMG
jgi:hypothetical protein